MPSVIRPTLRWNSAIATCVLSPNIPSTPPGSNPSPLSRRCTSATSSPCSIGYAGTRAGHPGESLPRPGSTTSGGRKCRRSEGHVGTWNSHGGQFLHRRCPKRRVHGRNRAGRAYPGGRRRRRQSHPREVADIARGQTLGTAHGTSPATSGHLGHGRRSHVPPDSA